MGIFLNNVILPLKKKISENKNAPEINHYFKRLNEMKASKISL